MTTEGEARIIALLTDLKETLERALKHVRDEMDQARKGVREWVTLAEAINEAGKSEASIRRYVTAGELRMKETHEGRLYHVGDLIPIKNEGIPARRQPPKWHRIPRQELSDPLWIAHLTKRIEKLEGKRSTKA